jgi:hypothetical protein
MYIMRPMSIKRTRTRADRRGSSGESAGGSVGSPTRKKEATWKEAVADKPDTDFTSYTVSGYYTTGTLLNHPTFGKGLVLRVNGQKIDVLFAEGKKVLVMGMAPVRP